jgi:signal transduction histidine kinase
MDTVGRLAGGMAHDFNNLLTIIGGNAELALVGLNSGQAPAGELAEIKLAVQRAAELIRKLMAFSRRAVIERRVVDLNAVLTDMERMLRRLIGEHLELVTRLADDLPAVRIDPSQVEQVLTNLVVNARDAMPEGGSPWNGVRHPG